MCALYVYTSPVIAAICTIIVVTGIGYVVLVLETQHKESHSPSIMSLVVAEERMRPGHWLHFA